MEKLGMSSVFHNTAGWTNEQKDGAVREFDAAPEWEEGVDAVIVYA